MKTRNRVSKDSTAPHRRRSSRKTAPQNLLGGVAVGLVALGCAWTLYANLFVAGVDVVSASVRVKSVVATADVEQSSFAERFDQASFAERFAPMAQASAQAAVAPTSVTLGRQVAWLDPTFSLGAPPERFRRPPVPAAVQAAAIAQAEIPKPLDAVKPPTVRQLVASIPVPAAKPSELRLPPNQSISAHELMVQRAKATVLAAANNKPSMFEKLFGKEQPAAGTQLAFAGSDGGIGSDGRDIIKAQAYDRTTAVYDISAKKVYMPNGTTLEAHSGLGSRLDNPAYAHERMRGVTPPHVYDLTPREALFHGVAALRLTPVGGEGAIYGRNGLLAHTYMLGPNGDSNGCVSFRDYNKFLQAYRNGDVRRLVVVARLN
ncbi:MAG TPA: DUF2778 domain-containing protein [Tardiphaga sp.]